MLAGAPHGSDALSPDKDQPDEFALSPGLQAAMSDMNENEHLTAARTTLIAKLTTEKKAELKKKVPSICPARTHCDYNKATSFKANITDSEPDSSAPSAEPDA